MLGNINTIHYRVEFYCMRRPKTTTVIHYTKKEHWENNLFICSHGSTDAQATNTRVSRYLSLDDFLAASPNIKLRRRNLPRGEYALLARNALNSLQVRRQRITLPTCRMPIVLDTGYSQHSRLCMGRSDVTML